MYEDLRSFLRALSENGWAHEIEVEVDPAWEIGAVCRENFNREGPALIFSHIKGFKTPMVVGVLGTREMYALALGCEPHLPEIAKKWGNAFAGPIKAIEVNPKEAPCKEVKLKEVNLYADPFPVPRWHQLDAGPELGTFHGVITKDPETGWINMGTYRNQIIDKDKIGCLSPPYKHIAYHIRKWTSLGKKTMPVAIALGLAPYLNMVAVSGVPVEVDEYDIAGGLKGAPIKVIKAETSDLLVPANAEIILEGEMPLDEFWPEEGPFGEFHGYMGEIQRNSPFIKIHQVTHRKHPYFQGTYEGRPPHESGIARGIGRSCVLFEHLRRSGCPGVKDVCVTVGGAAGLHAAVSIKKSFPGHARSVMALVWGFNILFCKHVVVVDEDIDVWDPFMVEWAIATRVQAARDVTIVENAHTGVLDPSQVPSRRGWSDWLGIDATIPEEHYKRDNSSFPPFADPPEEIMQMVRQRWGEYGIK
jgi:2,5-furandicarboxylate decarboxylase 1